MACMLRSLQCRNKVVYGKQALQHNVAAANHLLLRKNMWLPEVGMAKLNPGDPQKLFPINFKNVIPRRLCPSRIWYHTECVLIFLSWHVVNVIGI